MFLVLWSSVGKKTALLVFSALGLALAKTKCAVCAWAFQYAAQRLMYEMCIAVLSTYKSNDFCQRFSLAKPK